MLLWQRCVSVGCVFEHGVYERWAHGPSDGAVYGQPLLLGGMVIAATENDSVYGLSPVDGRVLWRTTLGRPEPLPQLTLISAQCRPPWSTATC